MKFAKILTLLCLLPELLQATSNFHERTLGFEDSQELREASHEIMRHGKLDLGLFANFKAKIQKRYDELYYHLVENYVADGKPRDKSIEKATKEKRILILKYMLSQIEVLRITTNPKDQEYIIKTLLRLSSAFVKDGRAVSIEEPLELVSVAFFEAHTVPVDDLKRTMPSNLVNRTEKRYYSKSELENLSKNGVDLSLIDPPNTSFWSKPTNISEASILFKDEKQNAIPQEYKFEDLTESDHHPKIKVSTKGSKDIEWKMKFSREVNTEYASSRILNLLGFKTDEYYYLRDAKVYFKDKAEFDNMVGRWLSFYHSEKEMPRVFIKEEGQDSKGFFVIFYEVAIEKHDDSKETRLGPFHLSSMGNQDRREVRSQLLIQSFINNTDIKEAHNNKIKIIKNENGKIEIEELIHDVGRAFGSLLVANMPNLYDWSFLTKKHGKLVFDYQRYHYIPKDRNPFMLATYSDVKWLARYFVQIQREQFQKILQNAGYPEDIGQLLLEKITTRRNEIVKVFDLEGQRIEDQTIVLWNEVNPKTFDFGDSIKNGQIIDDYKPQSGFTNYISGVGINFDFGSTIAHYLMNTASQAMERIPIERIISLNQSMGDVTLQYGLGVIGLRIGRQVHKNESTEDQSKLWKIQDRIEFTLNAALGINIPFGPAGVFTQLRTRAFLGKEFQTTTFSPDLKQATKKNLARIFTQPFKKQKIIEALKPGESYSDGIFVGLNFRESIQYGLMFALDGGLFLNQKQKYLVKSELQRTGETTYDVTFEKDYEFKADAALSIQLIQGLQLDAMSISGTFGKSKGRIFHLDKQRDTSHTQLQAYNELVYSFKDDLAEKEIPYSTLKKKYEDLAWKLGFTSYVAAGFHWKRSLLIDPDAKVTPLVEYTSNRDKNNAWMFRNTEHKAITRILYEDESYDKIKHKSVQVAYVSKSEKATHDYMKTNIENVNLLTNEPGFVKLSPELYSERHLGETFTQLNMTFKDPAVICLLEQKGCAKPKIGDLTLQFSLFRILHTHTEEDQMKRLARFLRKSMRNAEDFAKILQYVGTENVRKDFFMFGEFLPHKQYIRVERN